MAHAFKWKTTADGNGWHIVNPVDGAIAATVEIPAEAATVKRLTLYGLKQAVADGGAKDKGTTAAARLRAMLARYNSIAAGAWDFRDGTGTGTLPDGDVYAALVGLEKTADTDEAREKWRKLGAPKRAAIRRMADVAEWLENNTAAVDADDALADFIQL